MAAKLARQPAGIVNVRYQADADSNQAIVMPHLTLAQVFDALSFYLDHQTEINEYIERNQVPDELVHPSVKAALGIMIKFTDAQASSAW